MLRQVFHKIVSLTMAVLVLLSTVSFTVEKHFCGDVLIDVAVFSQVEKCASEIESSAITKKSCCKDTRDIIEGQDKLTVKSFDDTEFEHQLFLITFENSYASLFEGLPKQIVLKDHYSPPNLIEDLQILDQVFLI